MMLVLVLAALATTPPDIDSWMGFWPGQPSADAVKTHGQPEHAALVGTETAVMYPALNGASGVVVLMTRLGIVRSVSLHAMIPGGDTAGLNDPFGVSLGDGAAQLKAKRGEPFRTFTFPGGIIYVYKGKGDGVWSYQFSNHALTAITLDREFTPTMPLGSNSTSLGRMTSEKTDAWLGARPDEQFSEFVKTNGAPLFERHMPNGQTITWNRMENNPNTYMTIVTRSDVAQVISVVGSQAGGALTDPFGVALGSSVAEVKAQRGEPDAIETLSPTTSYVYHGAGGGKWYYDFRDGKLASVQLSSGHLLPTASPPGKEDPRDGASADTAFVIHALDANEGIRFERFYAGQAPGCRGGWQVALGAYFPGNAGRKYNELDLTCSDGKEKTIYFDITSFAGKF